MADDPDSLAENYEYQVPIFVLTHHPPKKKPKETDQLTLTFVTDGLESAVRQVKEAAGDKEVNIIGAANTAQQCLKAGLADELHVDIMPYCCVVACDSLNILALNRFNWNGSRSWDFQAAGHIFDSALLSRICFKGAKTLCEK